MFKVRNILHLKLNLLVTGPAPGKILLKAKVYLLGSKRADISLDTEVYLHVKGYSLARVTHLDIENPLLNQILPPKAHQYLKVLGIPGGIRILLNKIAKVSLNNDHVLVNSIDILCSDLVDLMKVGESTIAYVGGKYGGIFIGFKKKYVMKLEEKAAEKGVNPL